MIKPEEYFKFVDNVKDPDLRQDCYLKILELAPDFKGTAKEFEKYLNRTIHFLVLDYYTEASDRKNSTISIERRKKEIGNLQADPETYSEIPEQLANINETEYKLLYLFYAAGLTSKEIAKEYPELGFKNCNTVRKAIRKIKNKYEKKDK